MNTSQLLMDVRTKLSAGGGQNINIQADKFWVDEEIITAINQGYRKVTNAIRRARAEYFVRTLRSDDSALSIMGMSYDPVVLKMLQNVGTYVLPPDFVRIVGLFDARDEDRIKFMSGSVVKEAMKSIYQMSDNNNIQIGTMIYDILGSRQLLVRPKPREDFDVTLIYERSLEPLRQYSVGTITVTNGSATASLTGADLANRFSVGDEVIVGTSAAVPTVDVEESYSTIKSVNAGGDEITFEAPYAFTSQTDAFYIKAKVPDLMFHHRDAISYYATYRGFSKGTNPNMESATLYLSDYSAALQDIISDVEVRSYQDIETVDAYLEDVYE